MLPRLMTLGTLALGLVVIQDLAAAAGKQYAFLVAVKEYPKSELTSLSFTENDIVRLREQLLNSGYEDEQIVLLTQTAGKQNERWLPSANNIVRELKLLCGTLQPEDSLLLGFSGHGVQFKGSDGAYFCPTDARLDDLKTLISLEDIFTLLADEKICAAQNRFLLVDACRNNPLGPFAKAAAPIELKPAGRRLPAPQGGVVALFSCSGGERSFEHPDFKHGVFFNYVIEGLSGPADLDHDDEISFAELEQYTTKRVQHYVNTTLTASQTPERLGKSQGELRVARVGPAALKKEITNSLNMKFALIPAGKFFMGSPADEVGRSSDETQVEVVLTKPFYLGQTEVTQPQWKAVMGTEPWTESPRQKTGPKYPATNISWNEATEYCRKLSTREGKTYRLPTEAEWEYACRGNTTTAYSFGSTADALGLYGWFADNAARAKEEYAHEVGTKRPNAFGLYDMHGNVWEWNRDQFTDSLPGGRDPVVLVDGKHRLVRGGCWLGEAEHSRSAFREGFDPELKVPTVGFRVAVNVEPKR